MTTAPNSFRIAKWIGAVTPDAETRARLEDKFTEARTWLRYGERRMEAWRKEMRELKDRNCESECMLLQSQAS